MTPADVAELAFAIAGQHPHRSPQRRAACHLWAAAELPGGKTVASVRNAVRSFGDLPTQAAALALLDTITMQAAASREAS